MNAKFQVLLRLRLRCCNFAGCAGPLRRGFTLVELLVVIALLALLAATLAPALARNRPNSPAIQCLNNLRQLGAAWNMYADDNSGALVFNRDGGNTGKDSMDASWVAGWLDFTTSTDNTNVNCLVNHAAFPYGAFLGPYVKSPTVFKCPSDKSMTPLMQPRVRSVSMNNFVGQNGRSWTTPSRYTLFNRISGIKSPALIFVLLDEHQDSINDGCFMSDADTRYQFVDFPASYHNGAGSFSFADGHCELHFWTDPRTTPRLSPSQQLYLNVNLPGDGDYLWLQQHMSAPY